MPEYLSMHAQAVMQTGMFNIKAVDATQGPFKYLDKNNWDSVTALRALCEKPGDLATPLVKLRGEERKTLEDPQNKRIRGCIIDWVRETSKMA